MNTHLPYRIQHINLFEQLAMPQAETGNEGMYLVFWWNDFALGDLYIEPGTTVTEPEYYEKLIAAIVPSIQFYAHRNPAAFSDWKILIRQKLFEKWIALMEKLFAGKTPDFIPEKVNVSVVICTRNRPDQLKRCLQMLTNLTCKPDEVIVVDNASSDDASRDVVKQFPDIIYVREPKTGLDVARNTGIRSANRPIIAFLDDDVTVHKQWVYRVWETFQDTSVAATTGLVIAAELDTEAQYIFEKHWSFNRGYIPKTYDSNFIQSTLKKGPPVWKIGAGANMAFRKSVLDEVGYFNELLDAGAAGCNGDSEIWYRFLVNGHIIKYNPAAIVFHEHRREVKELKKQLFFYMRGHAAAALIQQRQHEKAGYIKHLASIFLWSYSRSLIKGFPQYTLQYSTLWSQIWGFLAGLAFYLKNKKSFEKTLKK